MRIGIRDGTRTDLPRVVAIEQVAFADPWSAESFLRELSLPFSRIIVSVNEDEKSLTLTGYLCRWLVADEYHILNVAVDPRYRREGIATALMDVAIAEAQAKQVAIITLEVRRSNLSARGLYRKLGFQERRVRKNYYGPGEDAIIMERAALLASSR